MNTLVDPILFMPTFYIVYAHILYYLCPHSYIYHIRPLPPPSDSYFSAPGSSMRGYSPSGRSAPPDRLSSADG